MMPRLKKHVQRFSLFFEQSIVSTNKMSATIKVTTCLLQRTANCIQSTLCRNLDLLPRTVTCHQPVRGRKRSTRDPSWFVHRNAPPGHEFLSDENRAFQKQVIIDKYTQSPLKQEPWERGEFTEKPRTYRTGLLGIKIGVIPQWTKEGHKFFTTMLQVVDNHVVRYIPPEKLYKSGGWRPNWGMRFGAVVVGAFSADPRQYTKQYNNLFAEAGVPPKRRLTRFIVSPNAKIQPGTPLNVMHFRIGDYVDVQAKTIDYGFQGVVKRWGMKGMPASHGTTKAHRKMGSTGGGGDKSAIWKGKHMPGHMGADWRHLRGLKIWRINTKQNVLYVQGPCVPGPTHGYVRIMDTVLPLRRCGRDNAPSMPTYYPEDSEEPIAEELFDDKLYQFSEPSIVFSEEKK